MLRNDGQSESSMVALASDKGGLPHKPSFSQIVQDQILKKVPSLKQFMQSSPYGGGAKGLLQRDDSRKSLSKRKPGTRIKIRKQKVDLGQLSKETSFELLPGT